MNTKNCILISSYRQHKCFLNKFLYTIQRLTPNNIPIYIIVSRDEEDEFHFITNKYQNINLLLFSKIIETLDGKIINENDLLKEYGKYSYQSLKKYYGLYYLFYTGKYDNVIIFDSETIIIRNVDINDMINKYVIEPSLIYSENNETMCELHSNVNLAAKQMLDIQSEPGWFLEYYMWIYEKKIFMDFMLYFLDKYDEILIELFKKFKEIFIEILYQTFIYKNNEKYKYSIINFNERVRNIFPENNKIREIFDSIKPLKPLEDCRVYIENNDTEFIKKIYTDMRLQLYKTNDTIASLKFVSDIENIKICVSEFSKIIFDNFHPQYTYDIQIDSAFVSKNIVEMNNKVYSLIKNTSLCEPYHWLGYDITVQDSTKILFSFDMYFNKLCDIKTENFIGFKRHRPIEIYKIPLNKIIVRQWIHYEYIINVTSNLSDLYIIIFDNAPQCDVLIRNFTYAVI